MTGKYVGLTAGGLTDGGSINWSPLPERKVKTGLKSANLLPEN